MAALTARAAKETCDRYFSLVVRARGYCERCGTTNGPFECAHIIRRRFLGDPDGVPLRHNETNAWCLCIECHDTVDEDEKRAGAALVHTTIGLDKYGELMEIKNGRHRPWREADWVRERARLLALLKAVDV